MTEPVEADTLLTATLRTRDACRRALLDARRELKSKTELMIAVTRSSDELRLSMAKTQARLVELTTEATKLLHADLAGVVGKNSAQEPLSADQQPEATPTA